jgi:putative oxidoreductase
MLAKLPRFQRDLASVLLRWGLAAIFIVHGVVKLDQTYALIPELTLAMQTLVGWGELIGGVLLLVGLLSRLAALELIVLQIGAIYYITGKYALIVAPMDDRKAIFRKIGPEYNLVLITACLAVLVLGSGIFSLDHLFVMLWRTWKKPTAPPTVPAPG